MSEEMVEVSWPDVAARWEQAYRDSKAELERVTRERDGAEAVATINSTRCREAEERQEQALERAAAAEKRLEEAGVIHTNYQLELMGQIGDERRKRESAEALLVEARHLAEGVTHGHRSCGEELTREATVFLAKLAARGTP